MPRKRSRPDWPITVYRFWTKPIGTLPQAAWDQAKSMQWLWNSLVERRRSLDQEISKLEDKALAKELRADFDEEVKDFLRSTEVKERLNWEAIEAVAERFATASREIAKKQVAWARLPAADRAIKRRPELRFSGRLEHINLPHRYTGGGIPASKLFSPRSSRCRLDPVPDSAYSANTREHRRERMTRGVFGLPGNESIQFHTILHRPIPSDAIVKIVSWVGRLHPTHGWNWSLNITVETPAYEPRQHFTGRGAGLDIGWRKMDGYLRVGILRDTDGHTVELRLQLDETATSRSKWLGLPATIDDIYELDSRIAGRVEAAKDALRKLDWEKLPPQASSSLAHLQTMRQGGLVKLMRTLEARDEADGDENTTQQALELLRAWRVENDELRRSRTLGLDRLVGRKRWIYENIAAWLAERYDLVIWEGELDLKRMAENVKGDVALEAAARYRQWAAPSELRHHIRRAFAKSGARLIDEEAAWSTRRCAECGEMAEPSARLILTCPNGHKFDQDKNAASNFLQLLPNDFTILRHKGEPVKVPKELERAVVVVQ